MSTSDLGVLRRLSGGAVTSRTTPGSTGFAVRFERGYPTSADDLWDAVTTPERVGRWLGALTGDRREGGDYHLDLSEPGDDSGDSLTWGRVVTCEPGRRLVVTWETSGLATSEVEVTTTAVGQDEALLVLEHRSLPEPNARGYGAGWHAFLDRLEDDLAGREAGPWPAAFEAYQPGYRTLPAR